MMSRSIIWFVAAALAAGAAQAKTVMWYRFEEQAPLTSTAAGVYVTNSVAATYTYPAHPRTINGTTYNDNNETTPMAGYLPTYTNSAPAGYCVYDPVTGTRVENRCGLHFHTTGSSDRNGGMLRITEDTALNAITNLTLEAFVRIPTDVPITGSYMRPIILKANLSTQGTWGLHVFESNLFYRATLLLNDNTTLVHGWGNGAKSVRIDDGRWHHLAVTFNFGTKKVYSYVDYVRISNATMDSKAIGFYHPSNSPLQIGGNANNSTRRHNGEIDEVRISDEALPPEKFLRYIPMREIDADTMYYLSFEDGAADWFSAAAAPLNASTNALGNVTVERYAGTDPASATNDVPGASIRNSIYASESVTNKSAVHLPVTAVGAHNGVSFLLTDPNNLVTASNFTFEAFVKTDRQTTKPADSQYADSFSIFASAGRILAIRRSQAAWTRCASRAGRCRPRSSSRRTTAWRFRRSRTRTSRTAWISRRTRGSSVRASPRRGRAAACPCWTMPCPGGSPWTARRCRTSATTGSPSASTAARSAGRTSRFSGNRRSRWSSSRSWSISTTSRT